MPEKMTLKRARKDKRQGKAPSTQAGEFVREEMHHIREGKHGASSPEQAIAIGLSKARRSGVALQPPRDARARAKAERDEAIGKRRARRKTRRRARVVGAVVKAKLRRGRLERKRAVKKAVRRAKMGKARTRRTRAT